MQFYIIIIILLAGLLFIFSMSLSANGMVLGKGGREGEEGKNNNPTITITLHNNPI